MKKTPITTRAAIMLPSALEPANDTTTVAAPVIGIGLFADVRKWRAAETIARDAAARMRDLSNENDCPRLAVLAEAYEEAREACDVAVDRAAHPWRVGRS